MNNDSENKNLHDTEIGIKRKRNEKENNVDVKHVNGDVEMVGKYNDSSMLKRKSNCGKNKITKKRKKGETTDKFQNGINNDEYSERFDQKVPEKSSENTQIKHVKLLTDNESNCKEEQKDLNVKYLRESFTTANGFDVLKQFVKICNENKERDLAGEYLNAGGNILEILQLLSNADKKGISNISTVFSAVRVLLIKILMQYPQLQSSTEYACRHLINSHLSLIHSMLSVQSNAKQRKVILQLLAVIVSLGGNLPRELLIHLSLPLEAVKSLVQHTRPADSQNIRNCFIHFVLAFIVEGNVPVIRALLDKRDLLSSIFPDLLYDSKDIVALVLTTLKTYILQNSNVSKTMKLQVFSTSIIQNIVRLYNWKGPYNWPKLKTQTVTSNPQYFEEKEIVTEIVHDFLITLLTSYRYGIIFHDRTLGISHVKHNYMVNTILQSLDRPWEHEKPSSLVIKIMAACPDLIKSQFILLEPYVEPRVSLKWIAAIKFVRKIIQSVDVQNCINSCSSELNALQLANAVVSLTLPGIILKQAIMLALTHSSIIIRHEAVLTLISMFNQIQKYLSILKVVYEKDNDFDTFKNFIMEFMLKNVPNLNIILKVWSCTFMLDSVESINNNEELVEEPNKYEHLTAVLNLLHMYNEVCPKLLDTLPDMQADAFLNVLNKLDDTNVDECNVIKVKAIQFLVMLYPNEFLPHEKIFKNALTFLISVLNEEVSSITSNTKVAIKSLLNATGMFEGCSDHLDIWINGFINLHDRKIVVKWFIHIVKEAAQDIEKYVDEIIKAEEIINQKVVHVGKLESTFEELISKPSIYENLEINTLPMQRFTSISPLLCCMLHKMKEHLHSSILCYMSYILIHTLHCQVIPQCLIHLIKDTEGIQLSVKEYLLSWLENNQVAYIKNILPSMALVCKLNAVFLSDTKLQMNEIFKGDSIVTFQYNGENVIIHHSLSAYEITCLFKMTIFYLTQFVEKGILTKTQYDNYKILLISLLHVAKESQDSSILVEECAKIVLSHPTILHYFSPFHTKSKDVVRGLITLIVGDICNVVIMLCKKCNIKNLFVHFKNKLLMQLCKMMDKKQKGEKISDVDTISIFIEVLQLVPKDVVHLLKRLVKLEHTMLISNDGKDLSIYGHVLPKLLKMVSSNEMKSERNVFFELDAEFVRSLCLQLLFLKSNSIKNVEVWETALHRYLSNFSFNIAAIDTDIFTSLLSTKITHATINLISFLISKNIKFISIFTHYMLKSKGIKENNIVLSVVASNVNFKWDQDFLQNLKKHYETDILSYLCNPQNGKSWIDETIAAICYLIKTTFDFKICNEACNTILQIGDKLDMVSINYLILLQSLYNKCATFKPEGGKFMLNLIQVLLHIITLTLKRESKNLQKLNILCEALNDVIKRLRDGRKDFVFEALNTNHSWSQFTRFSLKFGLKKLKNDEEQIPILRILSMLCDIAYKNDSNNEYVKTLFEMTTSHSEFINIMLGLTDTKRDLVGLLWIFVQKNKTVMASTHVPVYLAAYNATLSEADQYILLILQHYERNNINIYDYQPYMWGNAAATHYSVKGETHTTLWRQPSISQVLNLFEENVVNNTIKNYPVDRALKNNELYEAKDLYDPAFYLPLLGFLLSENNVVSCHKVAQSGALALTLAACSSKHSDTRMLAYTVIARYYTHLEASSSKAKLLWMRLIDAMRYGILSLPSEFNDVRLNCLVSTFLARTSLIATQPLHPLYSALQTFLMAKPALDITTIPELLQLFHSSDVQHKAHRYWILENIRDGMKTEGELDVAFKCVLFKMLLDFYICTLSDSNTKKLILEIVDVTLKIPKAPVLLIEGHGLFPWLLEVATNLHRYGVQHTELVVRIMDKLLNTILNTKGDVVHYKLMLLNIALCLKPDLLKVIRIDTFTLYMNILQKLILSKHMKRVVSKEHILEVVEFSRNIFENIEECDDMLRFGCEYVTKIDSSKNDNEVQVARNSLRTLVWTWCSHEVK